MEVTIAKALKIKNRIINKIKVLARTIMSNNKVLRGNTPVNLDEKVAEFRKMKSFLVEIKTKIESASAEIRPDIFKISELKDEVKMWKDQVETAESKLHHEKSGFREDDIVYEIFYTQDNINATIYLLETEIDSIQDKIDQFNNTHKITLSFDLV